MGTAVRAGERGHPIKGGEEMGGGGVEDERNKGHGKKGAVKIQW